MTTSTNTTKSTAKTVAKKTPATKTAAAKGQVKQPELVKLSSIARELNMTPKKARFILRRAKVAKPENGWNFSKANAVKIKAKLTPAPQASA